tara:strand:- start:968 stop:1240 length:273 start_codon:yes stop_codon:yes gene_type:complete
MDKEQTLNQILDYLNKVKTRTTYGVVAELLGVIPQSVGQHLGEKRPEVSWVVNGTTKEPTGYSEAEKHPDLYRTDRVIESAEVIRRNLGW